LAGLIVEVLIHRDKPEATGTIRLSAEGRPEFDYEGLERRYYPYQKLLALEILRHVKPLKK
jgi:hypothetical protein